MAWSEAIKAEWDKHQSRFAERWLGTMMKLKKLRPVKDERCDDLRRAMAEHSQDQHVVAIMAKDAHLVEAALSIDMRIASLDEAARGHFGRLAASFNPLRRVVWVNPSLENELATEWLQLGAPAERCRRLKP